MEELRLDDKMIELLEEQFVCVPASLTVDPNWLKKNHFFADRLVDVSVNLLGCNKDFSSKVRLAIERVSKSNEEVKALALESFEDDVRFVDTTTRKYQKNKVENWLNLVDVVYGCLYKDHIIGFVAIKEFYDKRKAEIYLAAVNDRYRRTGAAISLYNAVADIYQKEKYCSLCGTVSTKNISAINIYSSMGAIFQNPMDIYFMLENSTKIV